MIIWASQAGDVMHFSFFISFSIDRNDTFQVTFNARATRGAYKLYFY